MDGGWRSRSVYSQTALNPAEECRRLTQDPEAKTGVARNRNTSTRSERTRENEVEIPTDSVSDWLFTLTELQVD